MTTTTRRHSRRHLDVWGLALLVVGLLSAGFSYCLVAFADINVLVIVPSIVAITIGSMNLVKREAPREK